MKKFYYVFVVFVGILFLSNFAKATENDNIKKFVDNMSKTSISILNNKNATDKQKESEYKIFAESIVDCDWVARFILGSYWREIDDVKRNNFKTLYKEYLLENYIPKLRDYNRDIEIITINKQKETVFMVSTKTRDRSNREINVDFRIVKKPEGLFITDIIPEGISFIGNQRTDVNYAISKDGFDKFMEELKKKIQ